jgi:hypothetical protein
VAIETAGKNFSFQNKDVATNFTIKTQTMARQDKTSDFFQSVAEKKRKIEIKTRRMKRQKEESPFVTSAIAIVRI